MGKHKGRDHRATDKKLHKSKTQPPSAESLESQAPQVPKPGINAKNQYR
jgi:hypothetical protein